MSGYVLGVVVDDMMEESLEETSGVGKKNFFLLLVGWVM
jgi:hypothetical protein